jgi:methyltransferase (TIGR00027 family)
VKESLVTSEPLIRTVSDTALWTAAYRADESDRPDALFVDRLARRLAGDRGEEIARRVKQSAVRFAVVMRTAVMDDLIVGVVRDRGFDVVVNLAAGLDARPYRLELPKDLLWVEADLPGIVEYKETLLAGEVPGCRLERVPVDLSDPAARAGLFADVAGRSRRVLVVTEGLLSYLPPEQVAALSRDLAAHKQFAEWITDLTGAHVVKRVKTAGHELKGGGSAPLFTPEEGTAFFKPHGWVEAGFIGLFSEGPRRGRDTLLSRVVRFVARFVSPEKREMLDRSVGVATLVRPIGQGWT